MKRLVLALIAAAVLALSTGIARADIASSVTITEIQGDFTDHSSGGVPLVDQELADIGTNTVGILDVLAFFDTTQTQFVLIIHTGSNVDGFLAFVLFEDTVNTESASWFASDPTTEGALVANSANVFVFDINGNGTYGLTTTGTITSFEQVTLSFEFYNDTDRLTINAIEVPEPATSALFALGAGGLVWVVRRRRRRLALASK